MNNGRKKPDTHIRNLDVEVPLTDDRQRILALEQENRQLRLENADKRNLCLREATEVRLRIVHELGKQGFAVKRCCSLLGIGRATYYDAQKRPAEAKQCAVMPVLKAVFAASGQRYGSRRLMLELRERGVKIGRFRVRRMMREAGLTPV